MVNKDQLFLSTFKRSDDWPKVRRMFIKQHPECAVCRARKRLTAHHIYPHYLYPALELEPTNLITLCSQHHIFVGHLQDFKSYNEHVVRDAEVWHKRIDERPKWKPFLTR